jgi:hypothetical protein
MARSNRLCAVSLQDVAKCTLPSFWSVSSWAIVVVHGTIKAVIVAANKNPRMASPFIKKG